MPTRKDRSAPTPDRVAQIAVAQFLLFEATVESLSGLGERIAQQGLAAGTSAASRSQVLEPFRSRYALLQQMMRSPTRH